MTPETAFFHKLLLQAGISDRYDEYIDHALINNNPLSNLLLDLAFSLSDRSKTISLLHQYTADFQINMDIVASLVWEDLHERYISKKYDLYQLRKIMYRISCSSECWFEEPWYTLGFFDNCWDEVEIGFLDKADFLRSMEHFLLYGTTITNNWIYTPQKMEET